MLNRIRHIVAFGMMLSLTRFAFAVDDDGAALWDRIRTQYDAHRKSLQSIEYTYFHELNGVQREARYSRAGEQFHHGSVMRLEGDRLGMPRESAWDGQRAYSRARLNYLSISSDKDHASSACPTPESAINYCILQAYGIEPHPDARYDFRKAVEEKRGEQTIVIVTFGAPWCNGVLTVEHACDKGYWPSHVLVKDGEGRTRYKLNGVDFADVAIDQKKFFVPVRFVQTADPHLPIHNVIRFRIDQATLKVNEPMPAERFALQPWPSEVVADFDTQVEKPALDQAWVPDNRVGFPFAEVFQRLDAAEKKAKALGR